MKQLKITRSILALGVLTGLLCAGCRTLTEEYSGRDPQQVWTAMKAVAESPAYYDDWFVTENHVAVYEADQRIEIHRELKRDLVVPGSGPQRESREYDQTVRLILDDEDGDAEPVIKFRTHGGIHVRARTEAKMYFADVWELLGGKPGEDADVSPSGDSGE